MQILLVDLGEHSSYEGALDHLKNQHVKHVGWVNDSSVIVPKGNYQKVYSNWSGSSCLYCDPVTRIAYSVDMG